MSHKDILDIVAAAAAGAGLVGRIAQMLPDILTATAALFAIVWTGIRIYEWARVRIWKLEARNTGENTK